MSAKDFKIGEYFHIGDSSTYYYQRQNYSLVNPGTVFVCMDKKTHDIIWVYELADFTCGIYSPYSA